MAYTLDPDCYVWARYEYAPGLLAPAVRRRYACRRTWRPVTSPSRSES